MERKVRLAENTTLIRRAAIRRILAGRFGAQGVSSLDELQDLLMKVAGIYTHRSTLSQDLIYVGAVKVRDEESRNEWWTLPAYNPNTERLKEEMDPEAVETEVFYKLAAHAVDVVPLDSEIYVMCEPRAGYLVGYWLSWLSWPGIVAVMDFMDLAVVKCVNGHAAHDIARRLIGEARMKEGEDDERVTSEKRAGNPMAGVKVGPKPRRGS